MNALPDLAWLDLAWLDLAWPDLAWPDLAWPDLTWMAWTWQTAVFFALLFATLAIMVGLALWRPEAARVGILRFPTTRGDRLFVTLLGAAIIHILWIGLGGVAPWPAIGASVLFGAAMFRWA